MNIALDDFGTGYSSLGYLAPVPRGRHQDGPLVPVRGRVARDIGLATAVIGLGKTFELAIVAEGIEFPSSGRLCGLGCELCQGFYIAKPMDSSTVIDYLQSSLEVSGAPEAEQLNGSRSADAT